MPARKKINLGLCLEPGVAALLMEMAPNIRPQNMDEAVKHGELIILSAETTWAPPFVFSRLLSPSQDPPHTDKPPRLPSSREDKPGVAVTSPPELPHPRAAVADTGPTWPSPRTGADHRHGHVSTAAFLARGGRVDPERLGALRGTSSPLKGRRTGSADTCHIGAAEKPVSEASWHSGTGRARICPEINGDRRQQTRLSDGPTCPHESHATSRALASCTPSVRRRRSREAATAGTGNPSRLRAPAPPQPVPATPDRRHSLPAWHCTRRVSVGGQTSDKSIESSPTPSKHPPGRRKQEQSLAEHAAGRGPV